VISFQTGLARETRTIARRFNGGQGHQQGHQQEEKQYQQEHQKEEARVNGVAEAEQVAAFMTALQEEVPDLPERIKTWETLRKTDALQAIATGNAGLVYTPDNVNLSIRSDARR